MREQSKSKEKTRNGRQKKIRRRDRKTRTEETHQDRQTDREPAQGTPSRNPSGTAGARREGHASAGDTHTGEGQRRTAVTRRTGLKAGASCVSWHCVAGTRWSFVGAREKQRDLARPGEALRPRCQDNREKQMCGIVIVIVLLCLRRVCLRLFLRLGINVVVKDDYVLFIDRVLFLFCIVCQCKFLGYFFLKMKDIEIFFLNNIDINNHFISPPPTPPPNKTPSNFDNFSLSLYNPITQSFLLFF